MRAERCACGDTVRLPARQALWPVPYRLHVEGERHRLWRARADGAAPRLYEEHLASLLGGPRLLARSSGRRPAASVRRVA